MKIGSKVHHLTRIAPTVTATLYVWTDLDPGVPPSFTYYGSADLFNALLPRGVQGLNLRVTAALDNSGFFTTLVGWSAPADQVWLQYVRLAVPGLNSGAPEGGAAVPKVISSGNPPGQFLEFDFDVVFPPLDPKNPDSENFLVSCKLLLQQSGQLIVTGFTRGHRRSPASV